MILNYGLFPYIRRAHASPLLLLVGGAVVVIISTVVEFRFLARAEEPPNRQKSLEEAVIDPVRAELEKRNQEATAHSQAVDSGTVHLVRPEPGKPFDRSRGWVIQVVRPFFPTYYSATYTLYELGPWEWADPPRQDQAVISYEEVLYTKTADSVPELGQTPWTKTMTLTHRLRATYQNGEWQVEEIEKRTPAPGDEIHQLRPGQ